MRLEQEVNIYGDAEILKRFQAAETSISVVQGNISALISESELIELQNSHTTMYSQMASLKLDVDDLELSFSDLQTKYNTVTGQYTELSSKVAEYKAGVDGLSADITAVEQNLSKNYSTTSVMNAAIAAKANEITASVSNTYATKTALNNANSEIDALQSWKNEASLKITDSAIVATVTSSSSWATKADKANLISQINQSAEQVAISASKIKLEGIITANGNFKILADGSMETIAGKIGGWTISGNNLMDDRTDFLVRIAAPTIYGGNGNPNADVLVVYDKINDTYPFVLSSDGTVSASRCDFSGGKIGGWTLSGNNLMNDKTNFSVKFQAATTYGGFGVGSNDILAVFDKTAGNNPFVLSSDGTVTATKCNFSGGIIGGWKITGTDIYNDNGSASAGIGKSGSTHAFWAGTTYANRNNAPVRIGHAGEFYLGDYLKYLPNGMSFDSKVKMTMGGWQIKTGTNAWGYDHFEYWDTIETQENGICAHGPWVIWGGWNGGPSVNVENYKFVVTDQGVCKAMSWVTGSRVEWKENIVPYTKSALQEIANSEVYYYDLKDRGKGGWKEGRHIGFVIGDGYSVSPDILDGGGGAIDMYSALAIAYKAIQEQQEEIEELKKKIKEVVA